ncbi:MAG: response regulator [Gemmatimonadales bacterium]
MDALIVDDDPKIREIETRVLETAGFMVKCVDNGLAALAELRETNFRVIILDIAMQFLEGTKFFEELAEYYPESAKKVVFVSGMIDDPKVRAFVEKTGQPFLGKPFEVDEFVDLVRRMEDRAVGQ